MKIIVITLFLLFPNLAQDHANYMARVERQGHQGWENRVKILRKQFPKDNFSEVCAESWPNQSDDFNILMDEFFKCWKQSKGHWNAIKRGSFFQLGLAKGKNGVWYCCLILKENN